MKYIVRYYDRNPYDPEDRFQINREIVYAESKEQVEDIMVVVGKEVIDVEEVVS